MSTTAGSFSFDIVEPSDLDLIPLEVPEISTAKSSPLIKRNVSIDNDTPLTDIKDNMKSLLPLSLLLTTSNNTTLSLHLSELIETNTFHTPKSVKFMDEQPQTMDNKQNNDYNTGDLIIVSKNKQGLIRYIGELSGDAHIWYGIELIGGHKGFHDGIFQGQRYFTCGIRQGIFVKKHQIVRKMTMTDFNEKPKTEKKKRHRKNSSLPEIPRKPGPRDIGRVKSSIDWSPIENADKIIQQENNKKFLDPTLRRGRKRPKTARQSAALRSRSSATRTRGSSVRTRSKVRINKDSAVLPNADVFTIRSKTPNPSRYGLTHNQQKKKDRNTKKSITPRSVMRKSSRSTSQKKLKLNKGNKDKKKKRKKKNRERSQTASMALNMVKSRSAETQGTAMGKWSHSAHLGFPDISTFMGQKNKKNKRYNKHMQSKSQGNYDVKTAPQPLVIIRVSSEENDASPIGLLNMSQTTTISMDDSKYDEDTLFAEVSAEIEQRKSGLIDLEQQLDALAAEDFEKEFEESLKEAQVNQKELKRNTALVDKLGFDLNDGGNKGITSTRIKHMLWNDYDDVGATAE